MNKVSTVDMRRKAEEIVSQIHLPEIPAREFRLNAPEGSDIFQLLNEALQKCSASGGGKVIVPSGRYRCGGPINMHFFTELHLEEGCFIKFTHDPSCYLPPVPTRWGGVEIINYSPMVYANGITDTALTGKGVLCGSSEKWRSFQELQTPARSRSHTLEAQHIPLEERIFGEGSFMRPSMIQFRKCERVLVDGITCVDAPLWMLHPLYCSHLTVRNVYMDSMFVCNDGIDVDSCNNVLIEKSHFRNGDDAVVLKSGRDADGRRVGIPCKNVVVRECVFHECLHGFAIGSELSGGAESVYVYDIRMEDIFRQAISFKSCPGRGGVIKDIHIADIEIVKAGDHAVSIVSEYVDKYTGDERTCYKDIELLNVHCHYAENGFVLEGSEAFPLENVLFDNVVVDIAPVVCDGKKFIGSLEFRHVSVNGEEIKCSLI